MSYFKHESSYVDDGAEIGQGTKIWHFCHIMSGAKIGENCSLGQNVNVGGKAVIGNGVKIQNNVSVYDDVIVEDGDAKLENGVRAGSTLTQNVALKNLLAFTGKRLEEILPLLSENPARLIKVYDKKGSIADGKDADIVLLDAENNIADVFVGGNLIER